MTTEYVLDDNFQSKTQVYMSDLKLRSLLTLAIVTYIRWPF
jgi:hypothetical protein